jgi:hypothetical protein
MQVMRHLSEVFDRLEVTNGNRVVEGCQHVGGALPLGHFQIDGFLRTGKIRIDGQI